MGPALEDADLQEAWVGFGMVPARWLLPLKKNCERMNA